MFTALLGLATSPTFSTAASPAPPPASPERFKPPLYSLLDHKYWVDEIYGALIVTPLLAVSRLVLLGGLVETGIVQGSPAPASPVSPEALGSITAACNPATFAPTPAGSLLAPPPSSLSSCSDTTDH